jgi:plastocyanin
VWQKCERECDLLCAGAGIASDSARFEPANLTIRSGDRIRFTTISGGPHNVAFDPEKIPDAAGRTVVAVVSGGNVAAGTTSGILTADEG